MTTHLQQLLISPINVLALGKKFDSHVYLMEGRRRKRLIDLVILRALRCIELTETSLNSLKIFLSSYTFQNSKLGSYL
jgi:hypothetical protein